MTVVVNAIIAGGGVSTSSGDFSIGRTITDAAIIADPTVLNITSADFGKMITYAATSNQTMTVMAYTDSFTDIPEVLIYLEDTTHFPTLVGEDASVMLHGLAGLTGLAANGYIYAQLNSQATYAGGEWTVEATAAAAADVDVSEVVQQTYNVAVGIMPSGNITNANGSFTLGSQVPESYTDGFWGYFAADAIKTGSAAGLYFCKMNDGSSADGRVYQNTYTPGTNLPDIPSAPTAFTDAAVAAFTGATAVAVPVVSVTKAANALGKNGYFKIESLIRNNNTAGNKSITLYYGASTIMPASSITTGVSKSYNAKVQNCNSQARQRGKYSIPTVTDNGIINSFTVDDASSQTIRLALTLAVATDMVFLQSWTISFLYKND